MKMIIKWILERKVRKARKNFYKQLKLLRENKVDFSKVPVLGITGELKGESMLIADKTKVINIGMPENAIVVGIEEEGNVVRYIEK